MTVNYLNLILLTYLFECSFQEILGRQGGCPQLACNPSGGFSFTGNLPLSNVALRWRTDQGLAGSPDFGCIGTSDRIVCPLRTANSTLIGLDTQTGKLVWHDSLLHYPSVPLIDVYSNVIACDGSLLVPYDSEGHLRGTPISFSPSMNPVFSLTPTDNDAFIISGYDGKLVTYLMNGIIHASIFLKASIEGVNGTFVPIITPVVAGHRAYFLTQFRPDAGEQPSMGNIPILRLYAVDILRQAVGRMNVVWFYTFNNSRNQILQKKSKYYSNNRNKISNCILTKGTMVFLTLHTQYGSMDDMTDSDRLVNNNVNYSNSDQLETLLYGFNDTGLGYMIQFQIAESFVALSASVDAPSSSQNQSFILFWAATKTRVYKIAGLNGKVLQRIDLAIVFGEAVDLTSKLMVVTQTGSSRSSDGDLILLAVSCVADRCQPPRIQKHYVILIDVKTEELLWSVATPGDRAVIGQLSSMPRFNEHENGRTESEDLIVASADGNIFALGGNINKFDLRKKLNQLNHQ